MKTTQINPINVSISLFYCLFALLSFFILKIAIKYFIHNKIHEPNQTTQKTLKKHDLARLNFSKIFLKTYFLKSTFVGSIFNSDKKYMLRQFLVLSSIAVCCFNINSYIIWPWGVGLSVFVITFLINDIIAPVFFSKNYQKTVVDLNYQESVVSKINQGAETNSIQIEYTSLQLSVSSKKSVNSNQNVKKQQKRQISIKQNFDLIFTGLMVLGAEILVCQCILTLSLSVSNSGVLNLVSIGIAVLVDQFLARVGIGILSLIALGILHRVQTISFFQNYLFVSYCFESINQEIQNIQKQKRIAEIQHKIESINKPFIHSKQSESNSKFIFQVSSEIKFIDPNVFEDVIHQVAIQNPLILQPDALLEEQQVQDELPKIQEIDHEISSQDNYQQKQQPNQRQDRRTIEQQQKLHIIIIKPKDQTDYFQFFPFDLQMFDDSKIQKVKKNKTKKKKEKLEQNFKIDPYFYFPYEQHKLSIENKNQKQTTQNQQSIYLSRQKSTIQQNNYLSSIDPIDITDDTIIFNEPSVNLVLQERNLNIKTLTVNQKAQIPPTARQNYKTIKKEIPGKKIGMKKDKKISPYLASLTSEAIKPNKAKKLNVSKLNKQNGKETFNSFLLSQTVSIIGVSEKEIKMFQGCRIQRQTLNGR